MPIVKINPKKLTPDDVDSVSEIKYLENHKYESPVMVGSHMYFVANLGDNLPALSEVGDKDSMEKGSKYFNMFADYFRIVKLLINGDAYGKRPDAYWDQVIEVAQKFYDTYDCEYAKSLANAMVAELEQRHKLETIEKEQMDKLEEKEQMSKLESA